MEPDCVYLVAMKKPALLPKDDSDTHVEGALDVAGREGVCVPDVEDEQSSTATA